MYFNSSKQSSIMCVFFRDSYISLDLNRSVHSPAQNRRMEKLKSLASWPSYSQMSTFPLQTIAIIPAIKASNIAESPYPLISCLSKTFVIFLTGLGDSLCGSNCTNRAFFHTFFHINTRREKSDRRFLNNDLLQGTFASTDCSMNHQTSPPYSSFPFWCPTHPSVLSLSWRKP